MKLNETNGFWLNSSEKSILMQSLLITPKDGAEFELLSTLLARLNIATTVIAEEDKEDIGLGILMQEADRNQPISRESVFKALGKA